MDIELENTNVRFESRFGCYFFARNLIKMDVIESNIKPRKYKKFTTRMQEIFTEKTTMEDIWDLARECKIFCDYRSYYPPPPRPGQVKNCPPKGLTK